jgi:phage terminase large subunit-like protein
LVASLPEDQQRAVLDLTDAQYEELQWDWLFWARPSQKQPEGDWLTWLILAGRGFGKTRTGAETIRDWACGKTPLAKGRYSRFLLVAETAADARDVMVEGESGILSVHPVDFRPAYEPSKRRLTWPNGATASLFNATEPDQLRGPQGDAAWCDELAKWQYARETWDMLQFALRLGEQPARSLRPRRGLCPSSRNC